MYELLVAGAFDLAGEGWASASWFANRQDNILAALLPGKAGDVRHGGVPSAYLASRTAGMLAGGRQPRLRAANWQVRPDGSYILLAGRIFDRDDLARQFSLRPGQEHAETYASLYEAIGEDCDRLICGDYAVIQWFPQHLRVRMARSPLSEYPLHVWRQGNRLAVASIPRPLFAAGAPSRVNDDKLADALLLNMRRNDDSWYTDLSRVAPGCVEWHDPDGKRTCRFWSLENVAPVRFKRDSDYVEAVDEQFRRAIRAVPEGSKRPGILLSGGLDSQAVTSYLLETRPLGERLYTYTSVPIDGQCSASANTVFGDERAHVLAFAEMYPQIEARFMDCADLRYGQHLDSLHFYGSWPIHSEFNAYWSHEANALAIKDGCDVLLNGLAGNLGFSYSGRTGLSSWLRHGNWLRLTREVSRSKDPRPRWRSFVGDSILPNLPLSWRIARDRWRYGPEQSPFRQWCALREDFTYSNGALERARAAGYDITLQSMRSAHEWRTAALANMQTEGPELGTAFHLMHGISHRDPTAYRPLLDLCMGIPDEQYLRDGETRWLARRLLKGRIPEQVRTEKRRGTQASDWHLRFWHDRDSLLAELDSYARDPRISGMLDVERMARDLREWPGPDALHDVYGYKIQVAVGRGVAHARFIRYTEGRNAG